MATPIRYEFLVFLLALVLPVHGQKHPDQLTEVEGIAPVDAMMWIHIFLQATVWGVLFPIGMVLGMTRSRWHVPLQTTGFVVTAAGYILGHSHKGRMFRGSAHGTFAWILLLPIITQLLLGIYLKLHLNDQSLRPWAVRVHGIVGKLYPILGWMQMLFGVNIFGDYCHSGDDLEVCLAHHIKGSAFIAYGTIMAILLVAGEAWVKRSGRSREFLDSSVITMWGIVTVFTDHTELTWTVDDMQHVSIGVLWWTGGTLGLFLSRNNQRTIVPAVIIVLTGWAMFQHVQELMISTKVHIAFGYTLILAGVTRVIEICFLPTKSASAVPDGDGHSEQIFADAGSGSEVSGSSDGEKISAPEAFRHLPPFLLVSAGVLLMSATDEELHFVHDNGMDHVTYVLMMFSISFILYTFILALIHLYSTSGRNASSTAVPNIEMHPQGFSHKWYARVSSEPASPSHVIGPDDD